MATTVVEHENAALERARQAGIVDCDLHNTLDSMKDLYPYLSQRWRRHIEDYGVRRYAGTSYPRFLPPREDARPPSGKVSGSDGAFMAKDHLDRWGIAYGILNVSAGGQPDRDLDAALAAAANDWQLEHWLEVDPRYRASMVIPFAHADDAVREMKRWEHDKRFVQVFFTGRPNEPMGRPRFRPIYEQCAATGLHVMTHAFGCSGNPITGAGWPSYYLEDHIGPAQAAQTNILSMIAEGIFEEFPGVRFVSVENGFGWSAPLAWRMDRAWELHRGEVWKITKPPSSYLAESVYMASQPVEEPERRGHLAAMFEEAPWLADRLVFASDYPHWDADSPAEAFPSTFDAELRHKIYCDNGRELYGLP
jgi:predicted TIM-barrel fold metal-dependent hydrolase